MTAQKKKWVRRIITTTGILGFAFLMGFFKSYHLPKIKSWLLVELEQQSTQHLPLRVWPKNVEIKAFPPGVEFQALRVLPQNELKQILAPFTLGKLRLNISFFGLLQGKIRLSEITLDTLDLKMNIEIPEKEQSNQLKSGQKLFQLDDIYRLPIDEFKVLGLNLTAAAQKEKIAFQLVGGNLSLENRYQSLLVNTQLPVVKLKPLDSKAISTFEIGSKFLVEPESFHISSLKVATGKSFLVASGKTSGDTEAMEVKNIQLKTRAFIKLEDIQRVEQFITPFTNIPHLSGTVGGDVDINFDIKKQTIEGKYSVETKHLIVDHRLIGSGLSTGSFTKNKIVSPKTEMDSSSGKVILSDFQSTLKPPFEMQGTVSGSNLDVHSLLGNIKVGDVPVITDLSGTLPCQGQLKPRILFDCKGDIASRILHVYTEDEVTQKKETLFRAKDLSATGEVTFTDKNVSYKAAIQIGKKSRGTSTGNISYAKGFDIDFIGDRVSMEDIDNLVNLKIEGAAALKGKTTGNSKTGQVELDFRGKKIWLEDFGLGNVDSKVRYKAGKLSFRKAKGQFRSSQYEGQVTLDVKKKQIFLKADMPFIDLGDVQKLFSRKVELPIKVTGTGSGDVKVWGPLDFSLMSYNFKSAFFRGKIASESYDELHAVAHSKNGFVKLSGTRLKKSESQITMSGNIEPSGKIDSVLVGKALRLEQSELLNKIGFDLAGAFDFTTSLKGKLPSPDVLVNGQIQKLVIGGEPAQDSSFSLNFGEESLKGNVNFIGKTVQANFQLPYHESSPFSLEAKTTDWDFTNLFKVVSSTARKKDFVTKLNSSIQLKAKSGGFWKSTGEVNVDEFSIRRGPVEMSSQGPMKVVFTNGRIKSKDVSLAGENTFLKVHLNNATRENFVSEINGKFDLSLAALLTPFLDEIRGIASIAIKSTGNTTDPNMIGSAFIENGFIKIEDFPHPFENIQGDILFNQKDILVNAVKANLGGGTLKGNGKIQILGLNKVPLDIRADFQNATLNVPNGIKTRGSGNVRIKGDWFPYTLSGEYNVQEGLITMEFDKGGETSGEISPSDFLPKFLTVDNFQPLLLDLHITLLNPVAIKNSFLDSTATGNISVKGPPTRPILSGTVTPTPGGKLFFRDTSFDISTGYVEFKNSHPEEGNIYLTASSQVTETTYNVNADREEKTLYDVEMIAQGKGNDLKINLKSQPPLGQQQIVSLLAFGVSTTPSIDDQYGSSSQTQDDSLAGGVIGTHIGSQLIGNQISKPLKEKYGVDLKISSSLNDEGTSYPKFTISKELLPNLSGSASRTIEKNPRNDIKFEYKLNNNMSFIGLWEGREKTGLEEDGEDDPDKVGVDFEYKLKFK